MRLFKIAIGLPTGVAGGGPAGGLSAGSGDLDRLLGGPAGADMGFSAIVKANVNITRGQSNRLKWHHFVGKQIKCCQSFFEIFRGNTPIFHVMTQCL
jgi:hypothetical protein